MWNQIECIYEMSQSADTFKLFSWANKKSKKDWNIQRGKITLWTFLTYLCLDINDGILYWNDPSKRMLNGANQIIAKKTIIFKGYNTFYNNNVNNDVECKRKQA